MKSHSLLCLTCAIELFYRIDLYSVFFFFIDTDICSSSPINREVIVWAVLGLRKKNWFDALGAPSVEPREQKDKIVSAY